MEDKKRILNDHKKVGKKLLSPFNFRLNPGLTDLSWVDKIMPEVIWISLINNMYGYAEGARLIAQVAKKSKEIIKDNDRNWCYSVSSFFNINEEEKSSLFESLGGKNGDAGMIGIAIKVLHDIYPKSPFSFIANKAYTSEKADQARSRFKKVLISIYDKTTVEGIFTQANVVYSAFVADRLKVFKGLALADFPEIQNYPHTEKSKVVAASIRSTVPVFFGIAHKKSSEWWWPNYFWNRGLEVEPCEFT